MPWNMTERPTTPATRIVANAELPCRAVTAADALADRRKHVQEDEAEQQRLDHRARDELPQTLPQHHEVAQQQRAERDAR